MLTVRCFVIYWRSPKTNFELPTAFLDIPNSYLNGRDEIGSTNVRPIQNNQRSLASTHQQNAANNSSRSSWNNDGNNGNLRVTIPQTGSVVRKKTLKLYFYGFVCSKHEVYRFPTITFECLWIRRALQPPAPTLQQQRRQVINRPCHLAFLRRIFIWRRPI